MFSYHGDAPCSKTLYTPVGPVIAGATYYILLFDILVVFINKSILCCTNGISCKYEETLNPQNAGYDHVE